MKILIIGSGGREHALAWKFSKEASVSQIFVAPGNAGTEKTKKCQNIALSDVESLRKFAKENVIDLTMVGSEELLAQGIVDDFKQQGLHIFGPHQAAAQLESSKAFAKNFMQKYGIKTAEYQEFTDLDLAIRHLDSCDYPIVIKADGLAAGKGVIIAEDKTQAIEVLNDMMGNKVFGQAGDKVIIETFLEGVEASILSFTDGETILPMLSAKDHKKIGEGETGLNTGGMGVICPNPFVNEVVYQQFIDDIMNPTLAGLKQESLGFAGVIFFGLMITKSGVYLLEYNMRMGDPETQAVLPLLNNDLSPLIFDAFEQQLSTVSLSWKSQHAACVVAVAGGYPESYEKGKEIKGVDQIKESECFIAGAKSYQNKILTNGGRVLNIVSLAQDRKSAVAKAYKAIENIDFKDMFFRKDIGKI